MPQQSARAADSKIAELLEDLASPDPAVRDGESLNVLCGLVDSGALTGEQVAGLAAQLLDRLGHPRVEARSFAALVLGRLVLCGHSGTEWFPRFAAWYAAESEVAGHDPARGWRHAVAHGADTLGAFGWTWPVSPRPVLDLAAQRMLHPGPAIWHDQEDDRLGFAIAVALSNPLLAEADAAAWLEPVKQAFVHLAPGPVPAFASNAMRTLRVACLLVGARIEYEGRSAQVQHAAAVETHLREALHLATPWMWRLEPATPEP